MLRQQETAAQNMSEKIGEKEDVKHKLRQVEELLEKTNELIAKNKTILDSAKEVQLQVIGLHHCPMCYQDVSEEHKQKIVMQEQQKVVMAESFVQDLQAKKEIMLGQREDCAAKMEHILAQEQQLMRVQTEIRHLREKKRILSDKKEVLRVLAQENNLLMEQMKIIEQEGSVEQWQGQIEALQKMYLILVQQQEMGKTLGQIREQQQLLEKECQQIDEKLQELAKQLELKQDTTQSMNLVREEVQQSTRQERELALEQVRVQTIVTAFEHKKQELHEIITALQEEKQNLIHIKEIYNWLEEYFLPLTYTIEKHIMTHIRRLFTEVFAEWFSILIDDPEVYATIDDGFSPVITQNGYEVGFVNLSGGERTSVALAYRLALNRVIHDVIQEVKTKELLILDEPTDGFSSEQLDKVREILEKMPLKQTIIVSHEAKIETFVSTVIRVRKEGHVSVISS